MLKLFIVLSSFFSFYSMIIAQDSISKVYRIKGWQESEKGKELLQTLKDNLEKEYQREMKIKVEFEPGMEIYANQKLDLMSDTIFHENSAHRHVSLTLKGFTFEEISNKTIIEAILENNEANGIKEWQSIARPNKFYIEIYQFEDTQVIVYAEDRPFNYQTMREEE